jgi:hypothetical protein
MIGSFEGFEQTFDGSMVSLQDLDSIGRVPADVVVISLL